MAEATKIHHRLTVDRMLGTLHLCADLPLHAPWTLIFGASGSGKSSLLRAACGLLGKSGVRFSRHENTGDEISLIAPKEALRPHRLGLGYAPQQDSLLPHLNVADNVAFAWNVRGASAAKHANVNELLELFEVAPLRARAPQMLSGGERQRVNLARAFGVPGARLLLLDEPFSGVGKDARGRLLERMQTWTRQRGVPVLSVSHDVDEALLLRADVVVLEDGQVVRRGAASEALAAERERLLRALQT